MAERHRVRPWWTRSREQPLDHWTGARLIASLARQQGSCTHFGNDIALGRCPADGEIRRSGRRS